MYICILIYMHFEKKYIYRVIQPFSALIKILIADTYTNNFSLMHFRK